MFRIKLLSVMNLRRVISPSWAAAAGIFSHDLNHMHTQIQVQSRGACVGSVKFQGFSRSKLSAFHGRVPLGAMFSERFNASASLDAIQGLDVREEEKDVTTSGAVESGDGMSNMTSEGVVMEGDGAAAVEKVSVGDVEKVGDKRTKTEEVEPAASPVEIEVRKIVDNASIEAVAVKDGADSDAKGVVAEVKQGMENKSPGGLRKGSKRKVAMLLAYCGARYQGMQMNPGAITIEGELEQALFRADAIAECNFGDKRKVDWMTAARTDKGVSAIGQIVSARLVIDPPGFVERVNKHLPKDIRVFGYTRVASSFNAKRMCDKRRYEYLVPVFAFDPHAHHDRESMNMWNERRENVRLQRIEKRKALEQKAPGSEAGAVDAKDPTIEAPQPSASEQVIETVELREEVTAVVSEESNTIVKEEAEESPNGAERAPYVFDEAKLQQLNKILSRYVGTHNFHNFTARIKPEDPSATRYILSFEAGKVIEVQGVQFVPCTVIGQSFMLHQIRKMIGTAVAIMRGCVPETIIDFALRRDNFVNIPMAPELGLLLHECFYTAYNKKFSKSHEELSQKGHEEHIQKFKHEVIYPHIAETEAKDGTMALWLHNLNDRHYPDFVTHGEAAKM
ncbi:hypothetical protein KC19_5G184700 [Ceratodon purpureus]|uniref:Pseudouridine synthase I TruA alpha/beta domain-containing protein n=1 Tax=Ceratodon purpureus TaxID=3225 RepID=A0A8T0I5L5_CERPU|nr:hypothetical protein KC19_5G184700 [Ceratodon purpureus]